MPCWLPHLVLLAARLVSDWLKNASGKVAAGCLLSGTMVWFAHASWKCWCHGRQPSVLAAACVLYAHRPLLSIVRIYASLPALSLQCVVCRM